MLLETFIVSPEFVSVREFPPLNEEMLDALTSTLGKAMPEACVPPSSLQCIMYQKNAKTAIYPTTKYARNPNSVRVGLRLLSESNMKCLLLVMNVTADEEQIAIKSRRKEDGDRCIICCKEWRFTLSLTSAP